MGLAGLSPGLVGIGSILTIIVVAIAIANIVVQCLSFFRALPGPLQGYPWCTWASTWGSLCLRDPPRGPA
eukprot:871251-Alexandrium_andersonii.AAC.1